MRASRSRPPEATVPVLVRVTAADIKRGVARNCLRCPVANAVRRQFGAVSVAVNNHQVSVDRGYAAFVAPVPLAVRLQIHRYDEGRAMAPFEFSLEVPRRFVPVGKEAARG